jgi:hypothetical protein
VLPVLFALVCLPATTLGSRWTTTKIHNAKKYWSTFKVPEKDLSSPFMEREKPPAFYLASC